MQNKTVRKNVVIAIMGIILFGMVPLAFADVYINVMALNGAPERKEVSVSYNLPGDLKADDILDANGLQVEYNVNDANYFVHGKITLDPKESKTFRIRVKDIWKTTPEENEVIKAQINKGYEQLGKITDSKKADLLKEQLLQKLDFITQAQGAKADTVEKRMDAVRSYRKDIRRLQDQALAVDYWRSEPGENKERIIRFKLEASNPLTNPSKTVKFKQFLPTEIKAQDVVESEGFEVRYDQQKQQSFLFKEDEIAPGEKKAYSIGIRDIWFVIEQDIAYLRKRADTAYEFLKSSKFDETAKFLYEHINLLLKEIDTAQALVLTDIKEHIGAFRVNQAKFNQSKTEVENLEKLLSVLREELEKSKVNNVLQRVQSLKGVATVAKQMIDKKPTPSTAWGFIGWTLLFVGVITTLILIISIMRSKDKKKNAESLPPASK